MIYFTSDLHLGHANVIKLCNRPFSSLEEMDNTLIDNWNRKVKGNDTVFIMGDLIFKSGDPNNYLSRLKGKKILLIGNHDVGWLKLTDFSQYFIRTDKLIEESLCNHMMTLCHYPLLEWRNSRKENSSKLGFLIHGHIHNSQNLSNYMPLFTQPNALNAGVDINNFEPVTFEELLENNSKFKHNALKGREEESILTRREATLAAIEEKILSSRT